MKVERGSYTAAMDRTCPRNPYCRKRINQPNLNTYDVFTRPQDSHVSRPFFGRKQVRAEDTAALTNGHIEWGTRGALSFGAKVVSV